MASTRYLPPSCRGSVRSPCKRRSASFLSCPRQRLMDTLYPWLDPRIDGLPKEDARFRLASKLMPCSDPHQAPVPNTVSQKKATISQGNQVGGMLHRQGQGTFFTPGFASIRAFTKVLRDGHYEYERRRAPVHPNLKQGCLVGIIFPELCAFCPSPAIVLREGHPCFTRVSLPLRPIARIGQTIVRQADDPPERNGSTVPFGNDWIRINGPIFSHVTRA